MIHFNKDKEPEINNFNKILLESSSFRWLTNSKFNNTMRGRSLSFTIHVLAAAFITLHTRDAKVKTIPECHINSAIARIYPYHKCLDTKVNKPGKVGKRYHSI